MLTIEIATRGGTAKTKAYALSPGFFAHRPHKGKTDCFDVTVLPPGLCMGTFPTIAQCKAYAKIMDLLLTEKEREAIAGAKPESPRNGKLSSVAEKHDRASQMTLYAYISNGVAYFNRDFEGMELSL